MSTLCADSITVEERRPEARWRAWLAALTTWLRRGRAATTAAAAPVSAGDRPGPAAVPTRRRYEDFERRADSLTDILGGRIYPRIPSVPRRRD